MVPPVPVIDYLSVFQGNTFEQSGAPFPEKHIYHSWNAVENTKCIQSISKYFQCCISRTHWVLLMWMAVSCRKFIISSSQKQFSFLASQKQSLFSASQKQFLFSASQKHFLFLASPSQVPPSYFQCLSWGSKPSNILEYSLFVNIPIIILDDVIEAYNLSHFLSISISGIEFGVLNYFPFYFCHFSIITEDIFWSQLITLLFDVFFVVDIDANVGDDADVGVDAYQTWELSKKITQPDFWAKNCTNKKCVNYDYFYLECTNALKSINWVIFCSNLTERNFF